VALLGQVDELEPDREGTGDALGPGQLEAVHDLDHAPAGRLGRLGAQRDRGPAQALDVGQQGRATL
jgi:hypothetical protein